jgi:hypothetical protein
MIRGSRRILSTFLVVLALFAHLAGSVSANHTMSGAGSSSGTKVRPHSPLRHQSLILTSSARTQYPKCLKKPKDVPTTEKEFDGEGIRSIRYNKNLDPPTKEQGAPIVRQGLGGKDFAIVIGDEEEDNDTQANLREFLSGTGVNEYDKINELIGMPNPTTESGVPRTRAQISLPGTSHLSTLDMMAIICAMAIEQGFSIDENKVTLLVGETEFFPILSSVYDQHHRVKNPYAPMDDPGFAVFVATWVNVKRNRHHVLLHRLFVTWPLQQGTNAEIRGKIWRTTPPIGSNDFFA